MTIPHWEDASLGTMRRAALWLLQVVGEGGTFTKSQLREAFPDVAQIDRRMRDLRKFGWQIDTNREDVSLDPYQQRFVRSGDRVWEAGKGTRPAEFAVTASQRHEVLMRDGHKCRRCGVGPGEVYAGTQVTSQLDVARRAVVLPNGKKSVHLVIECNRCRVGGRDLVVDLGGILRRINMLPELEKKMLSTWVEQDARSFSAVEQLWAEYHTLPAEAREQVRAALTA